VRAFHSVYRPFTHVVEISPECGRDIVASSIAAPIQGSNKKDKSLYRKHEGIMD